MWRSGRGGDGGDCVRWANAERKIEGCITERYIPAQCEQDAAPSTPPPPLHTLSSGRDVSCGCGWLGLVHG